MNKNFPLLKNWPSLFFLKKTAQLNLLLLLFWRERWFWWWKWKLSLRWIFKKTFSNGRGWAFGIWDVDANFCDYCLKFSMESFGYFWYKEMQAPFVTTLGLSQFFIKSWHSRLTWSLYYKRASKIRTKHYGA